MQDKEIALQLTLSAVERGMLLPISKTNGIEQFNKFNAKEIADFYLNVLSAISGKSSDEQ